MKPLPSQRIRELATAGLTVDGEHHKQWYLEEIAKLVLSPREWEDLDGDYDPGVPA